MGVFNSPGTFQEKISKLFEGFYMVRVYVYDELLVTKNDFKDHLNALEKVLQRLTKVGFKLITECHSLDK